MIGVLLVVGMMLVLPAMAMAASLWIPTGIGRIVKK